MEPHEKMHYLFHNLLRTLFILIGHDIFREGEFKPYPLTYFMYGLLAWFLASTFKTVAYYDRTVVLQMIAFLGVAAELCVKIYSVKYGRMAVEVMDKITAIYAANSKSTSRDRLKLINLFSTITEVMIKGGLALYFMAGIFYMINAIYSYYAKHEIIPLVPVYMIFIDETTKQGFIALGITHIIFIIVTVIGTACTDFMFVMIIVNIPVLSTIFADNVKELNEILNEKTVDVPLAKAKLKNILLMHKEIWEIIDSLDTAFFKICFVQISCAAGSAAVELFICLKIEFFPAIALAWSFLTQIVCFCAVGTIIEICNGQIYDAIIRGDWFLLPCVVQLMYKFLMLNSQETKALTIGGIAPLNMISCVSILKTIYSYLMILYTFVD